MTHFGQSGKPLRSAVICYVTRVRGYSASRSEKTEYAKLLIYCQVNYSCLEAHPGCTLYLVPWTVFHSARNQMGEQRVAVLGLLSNACLLSNGRCRLIS